LALYLGHVDAEDRPAAARWLSLGDLFEHLTYRQRYEALRSEMTRDRLTGVFNRAFFDDICTPLAADSLRSGRPVTLLMIDVDHFKEINDTFGHRLGDRVLQGVATSVRGACRGSDLVCRYGGEEFGVLLPNTHLPAGISVAGRVGPAVTAALAQDDQRWVTRPVTVTIGAACFPSEAATFDDLIQLADRRMYEGKESGRNRVVPFSSEEPRENESTTPARGTEVPS
jgi:diguanylate cyclase (GGDEF)-like protein